jgi:hypothetical protein
MKIGEALFHIVLLFVDDFVSFENFNPIVENNVNTLRSLCIMYMLGNLK